jgi:hypothetical protein
VFDILCYSTPFGSDTVTNAVYVVQQHRLGKRSSMGI